MLLFIHKLVRVMAILGGLVLSVLVVLVCISVSGRGGNTFAHWDKLQEVAPALSTALIQSGIGPLSGDFELVEAGVAFAIFSFLPLCQLYSGHATVDIFTSQLPKRYNSWLIAFWETCLSLVILLITWRLLAGMLDKYGNGETTFILTFPIWWAYAASFAAASLASLVSVYCAVARIAEATTGRQLLPTGDGAIH